LPHKESEMTLREFVADFSSFHKNLTNRRFVWVLGAGASQQSGIPTGSELVDQWLEQMRVREGDAPMESWATARQLKINCFTYEERAHFYAQIYQRRFRFLPEEGYAHLEQLMTGKEPSPGYSILAAILAAQPPRHNIVITTNFDSLVAQALSTYTDTAPLVVGHESLAHFIDASMRQPIICKIHRDLFLAPKNDYRSLQRLHESWGQPLRTLFQQYTPIFIGYGGNDNTLMNLLESLEPDEIKGPRPYWCYYHKDKPSERITNLVSYLNGHLVKVPDFDSLMLILGLEMEVGLQDREIDRRARQRRRRYIQRIIKLDKTGYPLVDRALAEMKKKAGGWWRWHQKAQAEVDPSRVRAIYEAGIEECRDSVELIGAFANFLTDNGDHTKAKEMYKKALEIDPEDSTVRKNFAIFIFDVFKDADEAEAQYRLAVKCDPGNAVLINTFANFLADVQKKSPEAEQLYRKAIQLDPNNAGIAADYASFLWHERGSYVQADWLYRTARQLDPNSAVVAANYAGFLLCYGQLKDALKNIERARSLNGQEINQLAAEIALYDMIAKKAVGESNDGAIEEMKALLEAGFTRSQWNFDCVLEYARTRLPADYPLFKDFANQILNKSDLDANFEKWRTPGP